MTKSMHTFGDDRVGQSLSTVEEEPDVFGEDQQMADTNLHEPGPSFLADDAPTDRLTSMPAWLQAFVAQEAPDVEAQEEFEPEQSASPDSITLPSDDLVLPDWLQDDSPAIELAAPMQEPADDLFSLDDDVELPVALAGTIDPDTFISEDDLPDWLKAFSQESATVPEGQDVSTAEAGVPLAESVQVRVPVVENIWLSDTERRALGPGGTLFALLAANKDALEEDEAFVAESRSVATSSPREVKEPEAVTEQQDSGNKRNSTRLLMLTLLIVLLVILVSYVAFR